MYGPINIKYIWYWSTHFKLLFLKGLLKRKCCTINSCTCVSNCGCHYATECGLYRVWIHKQVHNFVGRWQMLHILPVRREVLNNNIAHMLGYTMCFSLSSPLVENFLCHSYDYSKLSLKLVIHFFLCVISIRFGGCYILLTLVLDKIWTSWLICCLVNHSNVVKDDWISLLWVTFSVWYGCSFVEWHTVYRNSQNITRTKAVRHNITGHSVCWKTHPTPDQ
jgi:hypothetical protein